MRCFWHVNVVNLRWAKCIRLDNNTARNLEVGILIGLFLTMISIIRVLIVFYVLITLIFIKFIDITILNNKKKKTSTFSKYVLPIK